MRVEVKTKETVYTLTLDQQELDVIETVLAQTSGIAGEANNIAASLEIYRTTRTPYTVKVNGNQYRSKHLNGIHFERVYPDEDVT